MPTLTQYMQAKQKVLLVGPPGTAKTARVFAAATELGWKVVVFRASLSERIDFSGALIPDHTAGVTRALPLEVLHELRNTTEPTILFLDDLGQAPIDVQAAAMHLFDPGFLPANILIWGATNRPGDKSGVTALCEPLRSRFDLAFVIPHSPDITQETTAGTLLWNWEEELEQWISWAVSRNADPVIVAWHRFHSGKDLYQWKPHADPSVRMADYRSWETVMNLYSAGLNDTGSLSGAIGSAAATDLQIYAKFRQVLPSLNDIWNSPETAPMPSNEPGIMYLLSSVVSTAVTPGTVGAFVTYIARMPRVFAALAAKDAHKRMGTHLLGNPVWMQWFTENQRLFISGQV